MRRRVWVSVRLLRTRVSKEARILAHEDGAEGFEHAVDLLGLAREAKPGVTKEDSKRRTEREAAKVETTHVRGALRKEETRAGKQEREEMSATMRE